MSLSQSYTEPPRSAQPPHELRALRQWVTWRYEPPAKPGAKRRKVLCTPGTARRASSTDPDTWRTYAEAIADGTADGIGFVFTEDDPYFGIDLDSCRDPETGEIEAWAWAVIERFATYTEVSPSETGVHLIGRGVKPGPDCRSGAQIECYDAARYFTFTGMALPGCEAIASRQRELTRWYHETWPSEPARPASPRPASAPIIHLEDRDLVDKLRGQKDGGKAGRLLDGNAGDYPSPSEARAALGAYACFYNASVDQVERLIRHSGLWKDGESESERDRKARIDAQHVVEWYATNGGERYRGAPPAADYENVDTETGEIHDTAGEPAAESELVAQLRAENEKLKRDRSQLIALFLNPTIKPAEKVGLVRAGQLALKKQPDRDGRVTIKAAEFANDWRKKAEAGKNTALTNPDGSIPYMSRGSVSGLMKRLTGEQPLGCKKTAKLIEAEGVAQKVVPKNGGKPWVERIWSMPRPASLGEFLAEAASFTAERKRKLRTITPPCPECGEVHPRTVKSFTGYKCHGCGGSWVEEGVERVEWPIVQIGPDETGPMPQEEYERLRACGSLGPQAPDPEPMAAEEPAAMWTDPDEDPDPDPGARTLTYTGPRRCWECHRPLEEGQFTLCRDCSVRHQRHKIEAEQARQAGTRPCVECGQPTAHPGSLYCPEHGGAERNDRSVWDSTTAIVDLLTMTLKDGAVPADTIRADVQRKGWTEVEGFDEAFNRYRAQLGIESRMIDGREHWAMPAGRAVS